MSNHVVSSEKKVEQTDGLNSSPSMFAFSYTDSFMHPVPN